MIPATGVGPVARRRARCRCYGRCVLADAVLLAHLAFVVFVALGGVLVLRWPRLAWVHVPAALWGAVVELTGAVCPLTPLENSLRRRAGHVPYAGGFVDHYVTAVLYPVTLTRSRQVALGVLVLAVNGIVYWLVIRTRREI